MQQKTDFSTSTATEDNVCPECDEKVNRVFGEIVPEPGDITICFYCRTPLRFDDDMNAQLLTEQDIEETPDLLKYISRAQKELDAAIDEALTYEMRDRRNAD